VNGLRVKLFSFSVRGELGEPQKNTFARASGLIFSFPSPIQGFKEFIGIPAVYPLFLSARITIYGH